MARAAPAEARPIVPDNIKISDLPLYNRDDKKIAFPAWRMQCKRMLASSNIPIERHSTFILGALAGGSLEEILAYFGPDGPPVDINPANLWVVLSRIFTHVELGPDRDNRFARVKLENFSNIGAFQEQFNREIMLCTEAPDENYRRTALINSISGLPHIKFEMEKVIKANAEVSFYELMQALRSCEALMPKKQATAAAAVLSPSTEVEAEAVAMKVEDLAEKIAQRLLGIRTDTGRGGGRSAKAKSDMTCYFCGKVGHMKKDCFSFKKSLNTRKYDVSPICLLINEDNWLAGEVKSSNKKGKVLVDTGAGVNIITKSYAERIGAKLAVGPEIRMVFADGRETTSHLQANVEFKLGEVSSSAKFRVLANLLPGVDMILGKSWLKVAGPAINFETGSVYVDGKHALGPKTILANISSSSSSTSTKSEVSSPVIEEPAATKSIKKPAATKVEEPAATKVIEEPGATEVAISVVGAKAMHKLLKGSNEATSLLFISEVPDQDTAASNDVGPVVNPAMKALVDQFKGSVLSDELKGGVPNSKIAHKIELTEGAQVPGQRPFRLSAAEKKEVSKQVTELMDLGLLRPSTSGFGAPILLVKKKDGSFRMCIDYRRLNAITKKDSFPLPLIDDLVDKLQGAKIFSKVDLKSGFHQVKMDPDSIDRTTFVTHDGSFEWLVMPMGLSNAPATFQRLMQRTLGHLGFVGIYLDDIIIFSNSLEEHKQHVEAVLKILKKDGLVANEKKCTFGVSEITFCGFVISNGAVKMEPSKVEAVRSWLPPTTISELRGFLGFINFYRKFLRRIGGIAAPLTALLGQRRGSTPLVLSELQMEAFNKLKALVTSEPVLRQFDDKLPTAIFSDSSDNQAGSFVAQDHGEGWVPIAFESHKLSVAESRYSIRDKELLAVAGACRKFRHWLIGRKVKVFTDHESLSTLLKGSNTMPSDRVARLVEFLAQFDLDIAYLKGSSNEVADALSRLPSASLRTSELAATTVSMPVPKDWMGALKKDRYFGPIIRILLNGSSKTKAAQRASKFEISANQLLITTKGSKRICVPKTLQLETMKIAHDEKCGGHMGIAKTQSSLQKSHFWPAMWRDIKNYVKTCRSCQSSKPNLHPSVVPPQPIVPPTSRWHTISMDFVTSLPVTKAGFDAILTVTDILTDRVVLIKTKTSATAEDTAQLFAEHIFCKFGMPLVTISDRDPKFTGDFWQALMKKLGTKTNMSTADYAQADGRAEKTNQTAITMMRQMVDYNQANWDEVLPFIEFAINSHQNEGTKATPFMADMGREPRQPLNLEAPAQDDDSTFVSKIKSVLQQAQLVDKGRNSHRVEKVLQQRKISKPFKIGDRVWVKSSALRDPTSADAGKKKLQPLFVGPFPITQVMGPATYKIELPPRIKGHNVLNVSKLKAHHENNIEGRYAKEPGAVGVDHSGNNLYRMDKILDMKYLRKKKYYLIQWLGYENQPTWEPASNVLNDAASKKDISDFLASYQPPRKGRAARQRG